MAKKVSVSVSKIFVIKKVSVSTNFVSKKYQIVKILLKKQEILSKISRGGDACFCQSRNPLKNIKWWGCLFLPIRKSFQKYQGVAVLFSADDRKSSKKYQGLAVLVSANPEILSKISRGGGAFFC